MLRSLVNGQRLALLLDQAVDARTGQWSTSYNLESLRKSFDFSNASNEFYDLLEKESTPLFTYKELATLKEREWLDL